MATSASSVSNTRSGRGLVIGLWVVQVLLALFSLMAGLNHGIKPIDEAVKTSPWIAGIPLGLARFIGFAELAAAVGLILPAATRIQPRLTPLAAVGVKAFATCWRWPSSRTKRASTSLVSGGHDRRSPRSTPGSHTSIPLTVLRPRGHPWACGVMGGL